MYTLTCILVLLQIKHWYIDFVNQSSEEVHCKGIYGNLTGIGHSLKHAIATGCILWIVFGYNYAVFGMIFDFIIHYHTDFVKRRYGNQDITNPLFWNHLGLDQLVHQLTYILLVLIFPLI